MFTEGEKTEPTYINHWHRELRSRVAVTIADEHGTPATLVGLAAEEKRKDRRAARKGRGDPWHAIWCVFDHDDHPRLGDALQQARDAGIRVAFSNPCIELWFILHVQDQNRYLDRGAAQRLSQSLLGCKKTVTPDAWDYLREGHEDATVRAKRLTAMHHGNGSWNYENPSSTVWELIEQMRAT